jgi:hypothetical protein
VIRRLSLAWPEDKTSAAADGKGRPLRLLAASDEVVRSLDFERNRDDIGQIDAVLGCGDLEPDYLTFLADAFRVPLLYVRGNHDRGTNWAARSKLLPTALYASTEQVAGLPVAGLSWPGSDRGRAIRDDVAAWQQAAGLYLRTSLGTRPLIVISHVPPRGLGDTPEDPYHRGFTAYNWLCRRLNPRLWLHGHTARAAAPDWRVTWGSTTLVNVTGAVLVELTVDADSSATIEGDQEPGVAPPAGRSNEPTRREEES